MPYSCHPSGAIVRLTPDIERTYRVYGPRREMTVSACAPVPGGTGTCQPMVAHSFRIKCDGKLVGWDLVAAGARRIGAPMPDNLPAGFAPVAPIGGRIIFPPEKSALAHIDSDVAVTLLPEHDVEGIGDASLVQASAWDTVVRAGEFAGVRVTEGAARFGAVLALVLGLILAVTIMAGAGLRPAPYRSARFGRARTSATNFNDMLAASLAAAKRQAARWFTIPDGIFGGGDERDEAAGSASSSWSRMRRDADAEGPAQHTPPPGVDVVLAMLERTETLVADRVAAATLRSVLQGELHRVHQRLVAVETASPPLDTVRLGSAIRAMTTELDRIARIAVGAGSGGRDGSAVPKSPSEAYEVLGVNPDVNPTVIKKLVDALRVSWHPDHARNDTDRVRREERIKQINAAWDIINDHRAAA